jgi:hypothetical protein
MFGRIVAESFPGDLVVAEDGEIITLHFPRRREEPARPE